MSHNWNVGDKFIRVVRNPGLGTHGEVGYKGTVVKLERNMGGGVGAVIDEAGRYHRTQFICPLYDPIALHPARPVRSTDPDTSKAAAKPNRTPLRERVASPTWNGREYDDCEADKKRKLLDPLAQTTRMLWAAWRDRAALERAHGIGGGK